MTLIQFLLIMVQIKFQCISVINDIFVNPLNFFSFKYVTPFQTKFKTPVKKNSKYLHQQSLLLNDTDIKSDEEDHIHTRIPKHDPSFTTDKTLHEETYSTKNKSKSTTSQESTSATNVQTNSQPATPCSQIIPFEDTSFIKCKKYFQGFFLPEAYSLDLKPPNNNPKTQFLELYILG